MLRRVAVWGACLCTLACPARAEESKAFASARGSSTPALDLSSSIELSNLPECIDEELVESRVATLVRPERLNPARHIEGTFLAEPDRWEARFRVLEAGEVVGWRRLEFRAGDCEAASDTVEVVLTMLLEGQGYEAPPPEPPSGQPSPDPVISTPEPLPAPPARPSERRPLLGRFRVGGELSFGVLPTPSAGLRLEGGVELSIPLAIVARVTWHPEDSVPIDGGGRLRVGGYRLAAMSCYLHRRRLVVSACGGLGLVALEAAGADLPSARVAHFIAGSAVLGARIGLPLSPSWSLEAGLEVEAWFARPEYVLASDAGPRAIDTASGVPGSGWLAVGYDF